MFYDKSTFGSLLIIAVYIKITTDSLLIIPVLHMYIKITVGSLLIIAALRKNPYWQSSDNSCFTFKITV